MPLLLPLLFVFKLDAELEFVSTPDELEFVLIVEVVCVVKFEFKLKPFVSDEEEFTFIVFNFILFFYLI